MPRNSVGNPWARRTGPFLDIEVLYRWVLTERLATLCLFEPRAPTDAQNEPKTPTLKNGALAANLGNPWGGSSEVRASARHAEGRDFETPPPHHLSLTTPAVARIHCSRERGRMTMPGKPPPGRAGTPISGAARLGMDDVMSKFGHDDFAVYERLRFPADVKLVRVSVAVGLLWGFLFGSFATWLWLQ